MCRVFPEAKWPGRDVDRPPPSNAEDTTERVELYLYFPSGLLSPLLGRTFFYIKILRNEDNK